MGCAECGGSTRLSMVESKQLLRLAYLGITAATRFAPLAGKLFRNSVGLGQILELRVISTLRWPLLGSRWLGVTESPVRIPHTCN
jgi:hypothetical protein